MKEIDIKDKLLLFTVFTTPIAYSTSPYQFPYPQPKNCVCFHAF